jgi:predicted nucleic acid-binding protein
VSEPIVTDSACLIGLERIGRLEILPSLFGTVLIPPEVQREFGASFAWLRVQTPADSALVAALVLRVDNGEAEAIALARELNAPLILDDLEARKVAKHIGVKVIGTLGVLIKARQSGIIPSLKPLLINLEGVGFYFSAQLKQEALRIVGE